MIEQFPLHTKKENHMYDITDKVKSAISKSKVEKGWCFIFSPHTTAGITINENADPDVIHDFLLGMDKAYPDRAEFKHGEGNSAAHLKTSALGGGETLIIESGKPILGQWQGVYFCEFDGPRDRTFYVRVYKE